MGVLERELEGGTIPRSIFGEIAAIGATPRDCTRLKAQSAIEDLIRTPALPFLLLYCLEPDAGAVLHQGEGSCRASRLRSATTATAIPDASAA
jgi:hypothetical protein